MKRPATFVLILLMATITALASFASGGEGEKGAKVTLRVMNFSQVEKAFVAINAVFMKVHPNIQIVYEPTPNTTYQPKFGAYIASKSGPDIILNELTYLWETADSWIPLNDKIKTEPEVFSDLIAYNMLYKYMDPSGPLLGLPMSYNGNVLYYNKDILRQAGLDPENPPQTWDAFSQACDAIKSKTGKAPIAMAGGRAPLFWDWPALMNNFWTSEQDVLDFGRGKIPWSDPRLQAGLKLMMDMASKGWFQDGWSTMQGNPDALDLFSSGGAAFIGSIISDVANWKQYETALGQDKVGVMMWPAINPNNPMTKKFSGFQGFPHCIAKWTKNPNEAWEYLKYTVSAEAADLFLQIGGGQPTNKKFNKSLAGGSPNFTKIQGMIQNNVVQVVLLMSSRESDAMQRGWTQVGTGGITLEEWTKSIQDALDQSRDKKLK